MTPDEAEALCLGFLARADQPVKGRPAGHWKVKRTLADADLWALDELMEKLLGVGPAGLKVLGRRLGVPMGRAQYGLTRNTICERWKLFSWLKREVTRRRKGNGTEGKETGGARQAPQAVNVRAGRRRKDHGGG